MRRIDLETAREARLAGQEDSNLIAHARDQKRVLLAGDKAFSEQNYRICTHPGIINVSKFMTKPYSCKERISRLLARHRRHIDHAVVYLYEGHFDVVKEGNLKESIRYT